MNAIFFACIIWVLVGISCNLGSIADSLNRLAPEPKSAAAVVITDSLVHNLSRKLGGP